MGILGSCLRYRALLRITGALLRITGALLRMCKALTHVETQGSGDKGPLYIQSIAFEVSFHRILQTPSKWTLSNDTWQHRRRELDNRVSFEDREMTLQMLCIYERWGAGVETHFQEI